MPLDLDALKADVTELLARFMHGHYYYIVEGVTPREKPLPTIRTLETCVTLLDELTEARRRLQWQPMATAPKDQSVLVYFTNRAVGATDDPL